VLLSSTPLTDLGKWLGSNVDMQAPQIERIEGGVSVVGEISERGYPVKMEIFLEREN